jgi:hypothetical protein
MYHKRFEDISIIHSSYSNINYFYTRRKVVILLTNVPKRQGDIIIRLHTYALLICV